MTWSAHAAGRVPLAVSPGSRPIVAVHELGGPLADRERWLRLARQSWGAWTYAQRGHAPSGWAAGRMYRMSDFAIDLVRLIRQQVARPCLLVAAGSGGLVAVLAAAAAPELIEGLHLLAGDGRGWGADPACLVSEECVFNRSWLDAVQSIPDRAPGPHEDDPILVHGPGERMLGAAVRAAAAQTRARWWASDGHFLAPWLPRERKAAGPFVPRPTAPARL